jgi:hypothetical protein
VDWLATARTPQSPPGPDEPAGDGHRHSDENHHVLHVTKHAIFPDNTGHEQGGQTYDNQGQGQTEQSDHSARIHHQCCDARVNGFSQSGGTEQGEGPQMAEVGPRRRAMKSWARRSCPGRATGLPGVAAMGA